MITKINKSILVLPHYVASNSARADGPILVKSNKLFLYLLFIFLILYYIYCHLLSAIVCIKIMLCLNKIT